MLRAAAMAEPFCPVVDAFRSMLVAIAIKNGDDPQLAIDEHRRWAVAQRAHEWINQGKGELNPQGACHETGNNDRTGGDAGAGGGMGSRFRDDEVMR